MDDKTRNDKDGPAARTARRVRRGAQVDTAPLDALLGFHVRIAMMTMRRSFLDSVAHGEVHPGLASLLQLVRVNPEASQVDLARALYVDKATLVALLNKAESLGWVTRLRSTYDRRRHVVRLTAEGEKRMRDIAREMQLHEKTYLRRFSAQEMETLVGLLRRIYDR